MFRAVLVYDKEGTSTEMLKIESVIQLSYQKLAYLIEKIGQ